MDASQTSSEVIAHPRLAAAQRRARDAAVPAPDRLRPAPTATASDEGADVPSLRAIVAMASRDVEHCDAASGILLRDNGAELAEASDPMAAELDQLQLELGEGPCLHACRTSSTVSSDDLAVERRWPAFLEHARRHGVTAIVSVPLLPALEYPSWCGWLTLYSRRPGAFPPASIPLAQALGLYCSNTVDADLHTRNLEAALASRDLIGQAKGIIMARRDVDEDQAFAILKRTSQDSNRRLRDVAAAVVRSRGRAGPR